LSTKMNSLSKKLKHRRTLRPYQRQSPLPPGALIPSPSLGLDPSIPSQKDWLAYPIQILGSGIDVNWPIIRPGGTVAQGSCSGAWHTPIPP
jgi:hypothetical protein